jgi:ABC-type uncharacterized transport system involved in gliding motility auxiliary subunit
MIISGDSAFLDNALINTLGNEDFVSSASNWLLDRSFLLKLGPKPIKVYRLTMTETQRQAAELTLVAFVPGALLLLGGLVWLRRRK